MTSDMTERDRLAADIASIRFGAKVEHPSQYEYDWADSLIALGWTRLDEARLARAVQWTETPVGATFPPIGPFMERAAAYAEAYREME